MNEVSLLQLTELLGGGQGGGGGLWKNLFILDCFIPEKLSDLLLFNIHVLSWNFEELFTYSS